MLVILGAWARLGCTLSAPVPPTWVMPLTPITSWPSAIASLCVTVLIYNEMLLYMIAAIADREMFVGEMVLRDGVRSDGGMCVIYKCLRYEKMLSNDVSGVALGCPREVIVEKALADLDGLVLVRLIGKHVPECTNMSKHLALRPAVYALIADFIKGRSATYEIGLAASRLNIVERAQVNMYSQGISLSGKVQTPVVTRNDIFDPLADVRPRYAASCSNDKGAIRLNVEAILPICIAGCDGKGGVVGKGGVDWIGCNNGDNCVSFKKGWAHKACIFPHGRPVPDVWTCVGCESGNHPATKIVTAGGGTSRVIGPTPKQQVLFHELASIQASGDFIDSTAVLIAAAPLRNAAHLVTPHGGPVAVAADGVMPICVVMVKLSGVAVGSGTFVPLSVYPFATDRFCAVSAMNPSAQPPSFTLAERNARRALERARSARDGITDGLYGRSLAASRDSLSAATALKWHRRRRRCRRDAARYDRAGRGHRRWRAAH